MFGDAGRGVQAKREPDGRDWEEIVHLLEIVSRESLKKMTKSQLVGTVLDLLAITSQLQAEKEKQFKVAVENILNRNCQAAVRKGTCSPCDPPLAGHHAACHTAVYCERV